MTRPGFCALAAGALLVACVSFDASTHTFGKEAPIVGRVVEKEFLLDRGWTHDSPVVGNQAAAAAAAAKGYRLANFALTSIVYESIRPQSEHRPRIYSHKLRTLDGDTIEFSSFTEVGSGKCAIVIPADGFGARKSFRNGQVQVAELSECPPNAPW